MSDPELCRPTDVRIVRANPEKARRLLGWAAKTNIDGVIKMMCDVALRDVELGQ